MEAPKFVIDFGDHARRTAEVAAIQLAESDFPFVDYVVVVVRDGETIVGAKVFFDGCKIAWVKPPEEDSAGEVKIGEYENDRKKHFLLSDTLFVFNYHKGVLNHTKTLVP